MMSIFEGAGVALITPFTETGEIDYTRLGELLEFQIAGHTDAIIICGCTGEAAALTPEERQSCIRYTVEQVAHRVPVIAGAGTNITKTAIEWSKDAVDCGADAILSITPYYNKATQKGLIAHYKAIAESVSVPIMLYNVPSRTGVNLLPQTAVTLARECANIVAIKEASGNISQIADLAALADGCLDIYSGNDDMIVPLLSLGGKGVVSVLSNVMPEETHQMVTEYLRGNVQEATRLQLLMLPLIRSLFCVVNPIPVKAALELMVKCGKTLRAPLTDLTQESPELLETLKRELARLNLL